MTLPGVLLQWAKKRKRNMVITWPTNELAETDPLNEGESSMGIGGRQERGSSNSNSM